MSETILSASTLSTAVAVPLREAIYAMDSRMNWLRTVVLDKPRKTLTAKQFSLLASSIRVACIRGRPRSCISCVPSLLFCLSTGLSREKFRGLLRVGSLKAIHTPSHLGPDRVVHVRRPDTNCFQRLSQQIPRHGGRMIIARNRFGCS